MINRRLFFRALAGAPAIAAVAPLAKPPAERPPRATFSTPYCECGFPLCSVASDELRRTTRTRYLECLNSHCRLHGRKFAVPEFALEDADPLVVRAVDGEFERVERLSRAHDAAVVFMPKSYGIGCTLEGPFEPGKVFNHRI